MRRTRRLFAFAAGLSLVAVAAACGDDDDGGAAGTTAPATAPGTESATSPPASEQATTSPGTEPGTTTGETGGTQPSGEAAMTITIDINPDAVWEDGSPITWEDFECTWQAALNTPGSIVTGGPDKIMSGEPGESDRQVVVSLSEAYAPYKQLFS